jgi:NitT/TauT family transport system substrate-binding protein
LEDAGVDTAAMELIKDLTMPQQLEALATAKLDAAQLFEPYASRALAEGSTILYAASSRGPTCYTTFITSRDSAAKRREEFGALTRATQAMLDWLAKEGPAELARVTAPFFPDVPAELLRAALERYHAAGLWSRTTAISHAGFERLAYSLHMGGFIKRRATYKECVYSFGRPA